jgi:hypothetical protein
MLVPGPHSLGQKLLVVSYRKIQDEATGRRKPWTEGIAQFGQQVRQKDHAHHRMSPVESGNIQATQAGTSARSRSAKEDTATAEQTFHVDSAIDIESESGGTPRNLENLAIHIGTISELESGQLVMRRTFRDPQDWVKSSVPGTFHFSEVCQSVGVTAGREKELFFFPDPNKDPHNILDEDELRGAIQYLCTRNTQEGKARSISLFVAADIYHVRALSLDQRAESLFDTLSSCLLTIFPDLSNQTTQTVPVCLGNQSP